MALPDADKWLEACQREWSNLTDMNCFQVIHSPSRSGAMPSRWVFKRKSNPDGTVSTRLDSSSKGSANVTASTT